LKVIFTGTGTSQGVPVIGCRCKVCKSNNLKDHRLRSAVVVQENDITIGIDAGPDFRMQMLRAEILRLDGLLVTHNHNDHVAGLDDVRPFNFMQKKPTSLFTLKEVNDDLRKRFQYIFGEEAYPGRPQINLVDVKSYQSFTIDQIEILPLLVYHANMKVLGYRIGDFSYITDAKIIPDETKKHLYGSKVLILNALHHRAHHAHLNLAEAIDIALELGATKTYLTHISHHMGLYSEVESQLPDQIHLAYDGLILEI
jgi:phosphoribosyl 1,2-cyclic phosphate phosphodiesterase